MGTMLDMNKGHRASSGIRILLPRQLLFVAMLSALPLGLSAQATSFKLANKIGDLPDAPPAAETLAIAQPAMGLPKASVTLTPTAAFAPVALVTIPAPAEKPRQHPFWDGENRALFVANGVMAAADFFVTRRNLANSGVELNPIARMFSHSTPALASNFALETGGVIGVGYLFHKTGHHRLERIASYVNLSASAFAVSYGLAHH
jgi:hypothetical protein